MNRAGEVLMTQSVTLEISVLAFAAYADRLGWRRQRLSLPEGSSVADIVAACRAMPGGSVLPDSPLVARNARFVALDEPVASGDEIALMPPVAGG